MVFTLKIGQQFLTSVSVNKRFFQHWRRPTLQILYYVPVLCCILICPEKSLASRAKITLYQGTKSYTTNSKLCPAGFFTHLPTQYTCACITGVWAFYTKYCNTPKAIIGGDSHCFYPTNSTIAQGMIVGNPRYPFETSLSHFTGYFTLLTKVFLSDDDILEVDPSGSFVTITDTSWTIYGNTGESLCLKADQKGRRIFCLFTINNVPGPAQWDLIVSVRKGCHSKQSYVSNRCKPILQPNDVSACNMIPPKITENPITESFCNDLDDCTIGETTIDTIEPTTSELDTWWVPLPNHQSTMDEDSESTTSESENETWWVPLPNHESTTDENNDSPTSENIIWWVPLPNHSTVTAKPPKVETTTQSPSAFDPGWFPLPKPTKQTTKPPKLPTKSPNSSSEVWIPLPHHSFKHSTSKPSPELYPEWIPLPKPLKPTSKPPESLTQHPNIDSSKVWIPLPQHPKLSKNSTLKPNSPPVQKSTPKTLNSSTTSNTDDWINRPNHPPKYTTLHKQSHSPVEGWIRLPYRPLTKPAKKPNGVADPALEGWIQIPHRPVKKPTDKPSNSDNVWIRLPHRPVLKPTVNPNPSPLLHPNTSTKRPEGNKYWIRLPKHRPGTTNPPHNSDSNVDWIPLPSHRPYTSSSGTTTVPSTSISNEDEFGWIPFPHHPPPTSTPLPMITLPTTKPLDICSTEITRDKVKQYWLDSELKQCPKSINEVVFTDQLRRFSVTQLNKLMKTRLRSLDQMETLLNLTKHIMLKTCPDDLVPAEFFNVAMSAFLMFIKEDFFYGVEESNRDTFRRIQDTLELCLHRARPYVFETKSIECNFKQITGGLILPGQRKELNIPESSSSKDFEPLIETVWKTFLNAHSYCFKDFKYSNDHHHFSTFIFEAFTKSIYEKWIEPLESNKIYSFIVPNFKFLSETMENIDFCVAATNSMSACPAWMGRSNRLVIQKEQKRKKRSIWEDHIQKERDRAKMWDGTAYCLQRMDEPEFNLDFGRCAHPQ